MKYFLLGWVAVFAMTACGKAADVPPASELARAYETPSTMRAAVAPAEEKPPSCFEQRTLRMMRNTIHKQFLREDAYRQISTSVFDEHVLIENALPVKWDKDIMRYECTATVVVDSSRGLDAAGAFVVNSPQLLATAGSSVIELEHVIATDLGADRKKFSYEVNYISQRAGDKIHVALAEITQLRSFLTGSFVASHLKPPSESPAEDRSQRN